MAKKKTIEEKRDLLYDEYAFIDDFKFLSELNKLINLEKMSLEKNNFFEDKGEFWSILETRTYMLLLMDKLLYLKRVGMYGKAVELAEEMLELSTGDNLGVRFHLLGLYAYFEDKKILDLHKKFNYLLLETFPVAVYYYKKGNKTKFNNMIKKIKESHPDIFENIFMVIQDTDKYRSKGFFAPGDITEVIELVDINYYLLSNMTFFAE